MSIDSLFDGSNLRNVRLSGGIRFGALYIAPSATVTMTADWPMMVFMTPTGGAVKLLLPPEATAAEMMFIVINRDAANAITVREDSDSTTILSVPATKVALFVCDGTTWRILTDLT